MPWRWASGRCGLQKVWGLSLGTSKHKLVVMNPLQDFGKILLFFGAFLAIIGIILLLIPKIPLLGRLPGDIVIKRGNFTFYFPLATSIILSILLSIIFSIFRK